MHHRTITKLMALAALVMTLAVPVPAALGAPESGSVTTHGRFATLAAGTDLGYSITGTAVMVRNRADGGVTRIRVVVQGLDPTTTYKVHVHNAPCSAVPAGGGHYQNIIGGPVDEYNEIWPIVTTNAAGDGVGTARHAAWARPDAQSVVIHWPQDSAVRLACADLD